MEKPRWYTAPHPYECDEILLSPKEEGNPEARYNAENLGDVMPREISQSQKHRYCRIPLTGGS